MGDSDDDIIWLDGPDQETPMRSRRQRRAFTDDEEDKLWRTAVNQMRNIDDLGHFRSPMLKAKAANPMTATFWRLAKKRDPTFTRGINTYIMKMRRMWGRQEFQSLPIEDIIFLTERLDSACIDPSFADFTPLTFEQQLRQNELVRVLEANDPSLFSKFVETTLKVNELLVEIMDEHPLPVFLPRIVIPGTP